MAAPLLTSALQVVISGRDSPPVSRQERVWVASGLAAGLIALTLVVPWTSRGSVMPASVNAALDDLPQGTVVFNEYTLGGWLEWEHRNVVPVVDGMTDAYDPAYLAAHGNAISLGVGWETFLDDSTADFALLRKSSPLALELQNHAGWKQVEATPAYLLLHRP
jgi:hypothetical protein